ncbi:hypothetical protein ACHAXR_011997 [Thalassiosira sp. AJA248-18]
MKIKKFITKGRLSTRFAKPDEDSKHSLSEEASTHHAEDNNTPGNTTHEPVGGGPMPRRVSIAENGAIAATGTQQRRPSSASAHAERRSTSTLQSSRCPFRHGTVLAGPYPGYVHGNPKRGICPNGCRPQLNSDVTQLETPSDTLLREAMEFIELYYHERQEEMKGADGFLTKKERVAAIKESIDETGTYEHTFDELQHGAQVAWRNAPKCANRKYWQQLKLLDCRDVTTNEGMFSCCVQHLAKAMSCGSSETYITIFKPAPPDLWASLLPAGGHVTHTDGPRIWNDQLLQYAAYMDEQGEVTGDPKNLRFTEMLKERFGWDGPPDGKKGPHDYLPLVIQADPEGPPELFEVPLEMCPPVHIHHPRYPELTSLNMRWYPIPAVCALDMTVGGIMYTAVPFNGWYANTEVVRDLVHDGRYNMLVPVARALGMDVDIKPGEAPFWKDEVMHILSMAVFHSYKFAKVAMIDHHTLIDMFWAWYNNEMRLRRYCPVNWKWVIPPMSPSTNQAYLGLNKAQEYTLKPAYIIGRSAFQLETNHFGRRDPEQAVKKFVRCVFLAILFKRCIARMRGRKQPVLIIYASVTGNAAKYAADLGAILRSCSNVSFFDACGVFEADAMTLIQSSTLTIFVSSTQGNGELPSLAHKFFSFLFDKNGRVLTGKQCAVLGFGSTAYPVFCGAAIHLSKKLAEVHADEVIPRGECDSVKGEAGTFYDWTTKLVTKMANNPSASDLVLKLSNNIKESNASSLVKTRNMLGSVKVEVFGGAEVRNAAALSYMTSKHSSHSRRASCDYGDVSTHNAKKILAPLEMENDRIVQIMGSSGLRSSDKKFLEGRVISREDVISSAVNEEGNEAVARKTSLLKIDLQSCGNPPYQPGDHIRVVPPNVISTEELETFVAHLSGDLSLDDHIYVSFENGDIPRSEIAISLPLLDECLDNLLPLNHFFETQAALEAPVSMQSCLDLACLATDAKDKAILDGIGHNAEQYENMTNISGMKWINLFRTFPSLAKQVSIDLLLCNMKTNHPRSYSISSCKAIVGQELHMVVGRFIYSRGGSKMEAGVCSTFLTSVEPGDNIQFKLESAPSFHHPPDPSCPIIFICTGTGIAPIRGLLQKRSHFKSRGEKLAPAFLIFGSRSSSEGLFHDEIVEFQKQGALTKIFMCYSREIGKTKEYTTDKLRSGRVSKVLSPILAKPNTHIFICGSANMAEDCQDAMRNMSPDCFDAITQEGRLHCDVFGALSPPKQSKRSSIDDVFKTCLDLEQDFESRAVSRQTH